MKLPPKIFNIFGSLALLLLVDQLFAHPSGLPAFAATGLLFVSVVVMIAANATGRREKASASLRWKIDANALQDAIFIADHTGTVVGANQACRDMLQSEASACNTVELMELLHAQLLDRTQADEIVSAVMSAPEIKFSERLLLNDGRVIERRTRPVDNSNERIWILRDVTQASLAHDDSAMHQKMVEEDAARTAELAEQLFHAKAELEAKQSELTRLANTDPMTGLWNRRRFLTLSDDAIKQEDRANSLWVIMMDIDHFKRINDTYGHAAGDVAIRDFTSTISSAVGDAGFVGRMGGEEFAAILSDCSVDEAYRIAELIRSKTTRIQTRYDSEVFRFTTSIGVAPWLPGETSIEPALDRADKALYSAKSFGRNRVVGYE